MRSLAFLLVPLPLALAAAEPDAARLQQLLKQYPAADTNKDGVLTFDEAQAYAKELRRGRSAKNSEGTTTDETGERRSTANRPPPTHADVSYGPHERNVLDLWLAKSDRPTPLVVYIHGGGFVNGSKAGADVGTIRACLDAGVSFMAINYRFRSHAPIQDILRDCARSIQFVRSKAKDYNLDPARIASYGGSAGAGTSLWLAFHDDLADPKSPDPVLRESSRIVAAAAINTQATYNLRRWPEILGQPNVAWERPGEAAAFFGAASETELAGAQAAVRDVDMLEHITSDDPPVFLYTAQPDGESLNRNQYVHHPNHARAVKKACDAAGVPAIVWFGMTEPRLDGDYRPALREFLLEHVKQ